MPSSACLLQFNDCRFAPNIFVLWDASKEIRGRLVEWVAKACFDRLNKLFVISTSERNYQTLLTNRNLLVVVREPQPYVLPIIPHSLLKVLVLREHHVLKDLLFYEVACEADVKACQDQLN